MVAGRRATRVQRDGRPRTAETRHRATAAAAVAVAARHTASSQRASGTARAMGGSGTGADALRAECRCPWSETCPWATAGTRAGRMRAAAGSGSGSASGRAAGGHAAAAVAVADTAGGCSVGGPWWAASPGGECAGVSCFIGAASGERSFQSRRSGGVSGLEGGAMGAGGVEVARGYLCCLGRRKKAPKRSRMTPHRPESWQKSRAHCSQRLCSRNLTLTFTQLCTAFGLQETRRSDRALRPSPD